MQQRLIELQLQRGRLLDKIANQRAMLARQARPLTGMLHLGDRVSEIARECKRTALEHPLTLALAIGVVVVVRPRTVLRWVRRGFVAWRSWGTIRSALSRYLAPTR
ncbi:MAG: YqjK family protein [Burkholderiaceae bacterium]